MGLLGSLFGGSKGSSSNQSYGFLKDTLGGAVSGGVNFMNALRDELSGGFDDFKKKAGFNFQLGEGLKGVGGNAAAGGLLRSGGTGKSFINYGNNLQSGMYDNYLNRLTGAGDQGLAAAGILSNAGQVSKEKSKNGVLTSLFSDRRIKQDIERIGTADNGLPIYRFVYKHDPNETVHIGFMADEVEKTHPDAVSEDLTGIKMVDYGKAVR